MNKIAKKIFIIIFISKKVFFAPQKKNYLLFNKGSEVLTFLLKKNYQILPTLQQEINFYILFKIFLKLKFTSLDYYKEYIRIIQPRIIITFIDNDLIFYRIKFFFKNISFIVIQNGVRDNYSDSNSADNLTISKIYKNKLFCDLVCLVGEQEKKFYKFIKTRFVVVGSVLNNEVYKKTNNFANKKKLIGFISQYRYIKSSIFLDLLDLKEKKFHNQHFYKNEPFMLSVLADYCIKNNYKLVIIGHYYKNSNESHQEHNFYKFIFKKFINLKWSLLAKKNIFSNYHLIHKPSLLISFDSTLGLEALARGIKVFRFQRQMFKRCQNAWIYSKTNGKFFSRNFDKKEVFKKFDNIFSKTNYKPFKYYNNIKLSSLIKFDPGNTIIKKIISNYNKKFIQ